MDSGSQHSYILKNLANEMQYKSESERFIRHGLFGGSTSSAEKHIKYIITVKNLLKSYTCDIEVYDKNVICADIPTIENGIWTRELKQNNIVLTDVNEEWEPIGVLIGSDMMAKLLTKNIVELICGVTAIETKLGWTLIGKKVNVPCTTLLAMSLFVQESNMSDLWKLDVMGIMDPIEQTTKEKHLEEVKESFRETVNRDVMGRYEVLLPWKDNHPSLICNKDLAIKRLEKTTKRLREDNLYESYSKVLTEWHNEGIIEKVSNSEYDHLDCYYLPHRHVVRDSSTTPIRPVFDASAHLKATPSLNQCLETGPNLIELIPTMLLRFREKRIGVISDIRKAFLQISVCPRDRDVLRFLWWDNNDSQKLQIYRHTRVVFGLTSSPFLLGATIEFHLENELKNANSNDKKFIIGKLQKSFYVDNCISSVDTENELILFRETAVNVMLSGGFDLRCWEYSGQCDVPNCRYSSVLGLKWDKALDTLSLKEIPLDPPPTKITKRFILSASHKIFDCMGVVCPVMLYPKLLLRKLWSKNIEWDKDINEEDETSFLTWYSQLYLLKEVNIQRWMFQTTDDIVSISFHVFVDASQAAYATVVFARVQSKIGTKVHFIQAKSRVAPMKNSTIPRLELLAATIGARLMNSTRKALQYNEYEIYFWSDSTTVLSWIKRNCHWSIFVRNRVQEIHSLSEPEQWRYIPGNDNPADLPSRGCDSKCLLESKWWDGPEWLRLTFEYWPKGDYQVNEKEVNFEVQKSKRVNTVISAQNIEVPYELCWYIKYFSDYDKILRMIAWMIRFINNTRNEKSSRIHGDLTVNEVEDAELILMKVFQRDVFDGLRDPRLSNLEVFTDDKDIIRMKSVIANKRDEYSFRHPIILDPSHELITRLIQYEHKKNHHAGVQTLLNLLRERYWILRGRKAVRNVITKCVTCKRYSAKKLLEIAPVLPENRVNEAGVFQIVGIDYAGPLYLKDNKKAWICLFTCAVYRAVHLELVSSLSTETFLQAFRRFVARRGRPKVIYSDNGTNFVSASNLLKNVNWEEIVRYSTVERIQWIHSAPSGTWWGGFWERLIRVVKDILRKLLRTACLNYEEMATILCDCESIVNSRPITYLSEDPKEPGPLSPSMFLQDIRVTELPDLDAIINVPNSLVEKRYQRLQKIRRDLRRRFRSEYSGSLCRHNKTISAEHRILNVGDVVLVGNDKDKRLNWPLAKVIQLIPGRDGKVRVARVKTSKGELVRPIQRLYPLEISSRVQIDNTRQAPQVGEQLEQKVADKHQPTTSTIIERTTKRGRIVKTPLKFCT